MTSCNFNIEMASLAGTSAMGEGVAQVAALAGPTMRRSDANPAAADAARDYIAETFARLTAKGRLDHAWALAADAHPESRQ